MEALIFCGIQASGKTTFYVEHFLRTHVRISLDLLNTRNKENKMLQCCLQMQQRFVVDNTNPTSKERLRYIEAAKRYKYKVKGFYFHTDITSAIDRNNMRKGKEYIPVAGIRGTFKKLEVPKFEEGFDELYYIEIKINGFEIRQMPIL